MGLVAPGRGDPRSAGADIGQTHGADAGRGFVAHGHFQQCRRPARASAPSASKARTRAVSLSTIDERPAAAHPRWRAHPGLRERDADRTVLRTRPTALPPKAALPPAAGTASRTSNGNRAHPSEACGCGGGSIAVLLGQVDDRCRPARAPARAWRAGPPGAGASGTAGDQLACRASDTPWPDHRRRLAICGDRREDGSGILPPAGASRRPFGARRVAAVGAGVGVGVAWASGSVLA